MQALILLIEKFMCGSAGTRKKEREREKMRAEGDV